MSDEETPKPKNKLDWDRIGHWLTLGANVGVLIGLILLIVELNQNQTMMRAQTRHEVSQELVDILVTRALDPQTVDIQLRAQNGEELTPIEAYQFALFSQAMIRYWEDVHYQYRMGLYDEAEFTVQRDTWVLLLRQNPGWMSNWCQSQILASKEFFDDMMEQLGPDACPSAE